MTLPLPGGVLEDFRLQEKFDTLAQQFPIGAGQLLSGLAVTALPAAPVNGQEIYYVADATNGVVWHLKYRAASAATSKWEYVGGAPLYAEIATNESTLSTTYVALTTAGPSIALPLAGDYMVENGFFANNMGANVQLLMSYDIGATAAVDADAVSALNATANSVGAQVMRTRRKTGLTAVTLTSKYRSSVATAGFFSNRWLRVTPVRLG